MKKAVLVLMTFAAILGFVYGQEQQQEDVAEDPGGAITGGALTGGALTGGALTGGAMTGGGN